MTSLKTAPERLAWGGRLPTPQDGVKALSGAPRGCCKGSRRVASRQQSGQLSRKPMPSPFGSGCRGSRRRSLRLLPHAPRKDRGAPRSFAPQRPGAVKRRCRHPCCALEPMSLRACTRSAHRVEPFAARLREEAQPHARSLQALEQHRGRTNSSDRRKRRRPGCETDGAPAPLPRTLRADAARNIRRAMQLARRMPNTRDVFECKVRRWWAIHPIWQGATSTTGPRTGGERQHGRWAAPSRFNAACPQCCFPRKHRDDIFCFFPTWPRSSVYDLHLRVH